VEHDKFLSFKSVFFRIPKKKILKALKKDSINSKEYGFFMRLHTKTEKSIFKLRNLSTILERVLRKNLTMRRNSDGEDNF